MSFEITNERLVYKLEIRIETKIVDLIESAFDDYLKKKIDTNKLCKSLSTSLSYLPFLSGHRKFVVIFMKNKNPRDFFGMRVFPSIESCDIIMNACTKDDNVKFGDMVNHWRRLESWILELDSFLFDRVTFNFTPRELTAMLLHEIGHVLYSERPLEVFYRAYRENQARLKIEDKATQKAMHIIYAIPLGLACMQRRWVNGKNQIKVEIVADRTVEELGYGEDLASALDKVIRQVGDIYKSEQDSQTEIDTSVKWCVNNIQDVIKRRDHLKDELFYQGVKANSSFIKAAAVYILDKLGFAMREKYNGIVTEVTVELLSDPEVMTKYDMCSNIKKCAAFERLVDLYQQSAGFTIANEGLFSKDKKTQYVLPSQFEVDAIAIELDNIKNHADRIYVLDLIYEIQDRVNTFEEGISSDPMLAKQWQSKITLMREELEMYRKAVLAKKTFEEKKYHCFVKLPEVASDYEG